mgnify:CR=1 FL=1
MACQGIANGYTLMWHVRICPRSEYWKHHGKPNLLVLNSVSHVVIILSEQFIMVARIKTKVLDNNFCTILGPRWLLQNLQQSSLKSRK